MQGNNPTQGAIAPVPILVFLSHLSGEDMRNSINMYEGFASYNFDILLIEIDLFPRTTKKLPSYLIFQWLIFLQT